MTTSLSEQDGPSLLPASIDAERSVLGGILLDNRHYNEAAERLRPEHFSLDSHRRIYSRMVDLAESSRPIDMITLIEELERKRDLQPIGNVAYVSGLVEGVPERPSIAHYVDIILEKALRRSLQSQAQTLRLAASSEELSTLKEKIEGLSESVRSYGSQTDANQLIVIRGDEATERPLRWMWKHYLPLGKLVHFGGNSSQAKSPVTVDLCARVSVGAAWPDGTPNTQGPRSAIVLNIEDDLEDTILPRFRLAGGEKSKLYYVKGTRIALKDSESSERLVTLESDMLHIANLARSLPDLGLIVIDPVTNYLGNKKFIDEADMRSVLTPLANLAADLGIVIITVGHFNRREKGTDPMHRFLGAAAFIGVARAVYAFGPDPEEESKFAHVMTAVRGCGGEGSALRYHTELVTDHCPDSEPNDIIKVVWDGISDATAEDSVDPVSTKDKSQEDEAAQLLKDFLRDGKKPSTDCSSFLKGEGYDLEKLNGGRIRRKAGVDSKKFPGEKFYSWYLTVSAP